MLADKKMFEVIENILIENGTIAKFEAEQGTICGHMMITETQIPEELGVDIKKTSSLHAFQGTFDFYDMAIGMALYTDTLQAACGLWMTPQTDDAEEPAGEWVDFFIQTLVNNIQPDGSFGVPMYSFVCDVGDFTVVSTLDED